MLSSLLLGMLAGTTDLSQWLNHMVYSGFSGAGSWVIVMMLWVAAFGGIMNAMNAFDPLARLVAKCSANVHHLLGWCGVLCIVGNMALSDETAQIATMSGIMRDIVDKNVECADEEANYRLRLRLATYADVMGIYSSQFIPWHCYPVFFCGIANTVCPGANGGINFTVFDIVSRNYLSFIVVGSFLLLSFTGWDRFIPGFSIPGKERAWLRRKAVYTAPSLTAERSAESV
jgi:Na+/H+ antiporter NhaC